MNRSITIASLSACLFISACSPMNTEFTCNATAGDHCLTIEQVDAMTGFADEGGQLHGHKTNEHLRRSQTRGGTGVWVAPQQRRGN